MKTMAIIQARMGSTRLPGKVLLPLGESCMLHYVVERSRLIQGVSKVVVATSTQAEDDAIWSWCEANGIECYRGSEEDVLSRYYECAVQFAPDYVIRITSDCPFVDYKLASEAVSLMYGTQADFFFLETALPRGIAVEMMTFHALQRFYNQGTEPRHREHVTYYAYEYPEQFNTIQLTIPPALDHPELRLTVDTKEDYKLCSLLAANFNHIDAPVEEMIKYLLQHPELAAINAQVEQKTVI